MADVIYKKGQSSNLDSVQIKEGQILVTEDTGEMYIDVTDNNRKKINSVSNSKSGSAILIDDVSPVTHEMGVKVRSKNLIPYPYHNATKTENGVTFTDNGDGSITLNGTPTATAVFSLYGDKAAQTILYKGQAYALSLYNNTNLNDIFLNTNISISGEGEWGTNIAITTGTVTKEFTVNESYKGFQLYLVVTANAGTLENVTVYPQLELGTTATDYTPYVADLSAVGVSRLGKNIFDFEGFANEIIEAGRNCEIVEFDGRRCFKIISTTTQFTRDLSRFKAFGIQFDYYAAGTYTESFFSIKFIDGNVLYFGASMFNTWATVSYYYQYADKQMVEFSCYCASDEENPIYIDLDSFMIEESQAPTDYEPYIEPQTVTANADGTVKGLTSLYPNTTLMTDTEGVIINCEYLTKLYTEVFGSTNIKNESINIKNGSSIGSLRTIGSTEESSEYTLGTNAFAEGYRTKASGDCSHAEGYYPNASGVGSHAEGSRTNSSGLNSHAEGNATTASGSNSHAEGNHTKASGERSHAEGYYTIASGSNSHAQGRYNISNTNYADVIGNGDSDTERSNAYTMDWGGNAWFAGDVYTKSTSGKNKDEGSKKLATEEYVDTQIIEKIDQTYTPTSENAQSGKAVAEALNTAAAIIPGEGTNSIKQNYPENYAGGEKSVSIGPNVKTYGKNSVGIGVGLNVRYTSDDDVNINGANSVNLGYHSIIYNQDGVSLGRDNKNYSHVGITAGLGNIAGLPEYANEQWGADIARGAIAMGWENHATHAYACVLGDHNNSSGDNQVVFGRFCADDSDALFIIGNGTVLDEPSGLVKRSNLCTVDKDGNACFTGGVYVGSSKKDGKGSKKLTTNLIDGSSTGSIRTIGSKEEDSSYKLGQYSVAEGSNTKASGNHSHAEGYHASASGDDSHAEGHYTTASGNRSHAEGSSTKASGNHSHAEGEGTTASGNCSHAEGRFTIASEYSSHAEGQGTEISSYAGHVQGRYNIVDNNDYADIIGNGSSDTKRSNAYTMDWKGNAWFAGAVTSKAADYAEFFEWLDGNPNNKDRVGYLVALDGEKIRFANPEDEILGIISANPAILGDNYECDWNGKYLTDEFGRILYDKVEEFIDIPKVDEETGETTIEKKSLGFFDHPRINPDYDHDQEYINRRNRSEWAMVGMLGKLFVRDDGTAQINGYVSAGEDGIATASTEKTNMRVLSRVNDHVVKVLLK